MKYWVYLKQIDRCQCRYRRRIWNGQRTRWILNIQVLKFCNCIMYDSPDSLCNVAIAKKCRHWDKNGIMCSRFEMIYIRWAGLESGSDKTPKYTPEEWVENRHDNIRHCKNQYHDRWSMISSNENVVVPRRECGWVWQDPIGNYRERTRTIRIKDGRRNARKHLLFCRRMGTERWVGWIL